MANQTQTQRDEHNKQTKKKMQRNKQHELFQFTHQEYRKNKTKKNTRELQNRGQNIEAKEQMEIIKKLHYIWEKNLELFFYNLKFYKETLYQND